MRVPAYVPEATLNAALIATYWALWFMAVGGLCALSYAHPTLAVQSCSLVLVSLETSSSGDVYWLGLCWSA